jgi:hypothetical protein
MKPNTMLAMVCAVAFVIAGCAHEPQLSDINGPPSYASTIANAPAVELCDLIRSPDRYDGQVVRTQAVYFRNMENQRLEDPACNTENAFVWVEFEPSYVYTDKSLEKRLQETLCPSVPCPIGRARVTMVGRFEGPQHGPFGHLDDYRFRFSVIRLEAVEPGA